MEIDKKAKAYYILLVMILILTTTFFILNNQIAFVVALFVAVVVAVLLIRAGPKITPKNKDSMLYRYQKAYEKHRYLYTFIICNFFILPITVALLFSGGPSLGQIILFASICEGSILLGLLFLKSLKKNEVH